MNIAITADPEIPVPPTLYGGIERIIDMLVRGLVERGHQVTLFAHPDSKVPCPVIAFPGKKSQHRWDALRNTWTVSQALGKKYDVLHSFGRLAYLSLLLPTSLPKLMSYQREPTISQVVRAVKLAKRGTLSFTGCSEYIAAQIRPYAPSYAIYNGVPIDKYEYQPAPSSDAPLLFLGRVEEIKGAHIAIEVARRTGRRLIIAGNVPREKQAYFESKIKPHLNSDQIRYVGPVNDSQKNELLGQGAALLMPILWNEPFGIVMTEALACGTPVIAFARGAAPEVVEHGINGFLCETMDDMTHAIEKIGMVSRASCRQICEERFSDRAIVSAYERLYHQLLN